VSVVLDASAILAFLHNEPGGEVARAALDGGVVSTVNWAEVVQKALQRGVDPRGMHNDFSDVGVTFAKFDTSHAEIAADIWQRTRAKGLSFADRACLALGVERSLPVLTADKAWAQLELGIDVRLVR
jgi:PIN domain nuclease of toxin-antitoxin system